MTLLELLQLLRNKWYFLVIFPVLFALVAAGYCWGFMPNTYTSSVSLYVLNRTTSETTNTTSPQFSQSQQIANDLAVLAKTNRVLEATADEVGMTSLGGYSIAVTNDDANRIITISVTGKNPDATAEIADALAKQTADVAVEVMDLDAVNIIDKAEVPSAPTGPNRLQYTEVAFLAGLIFAIILIVLLDLLNTSIKSAEEIEELVGLPNLGTMPKVKKIAK